ncbi:unnamed protein product [Durusdinium trenchii]
MATFPDIFRGRTGMKSGMLGRWMVQSKEQCWDQIPWEKMSAEDRKMKELPDWVRQPLGLNKRMRFSAGKDIPQVVKSGLIKLVERVSCGGKDSELTCGTAATKQLKEEAEALLQKYNEAQSQVASEHNVDVPLCKAKVTTKWVNRLLKSSGILRRSPNTMGAYLEYDDQRMCQSRKAWKFVRMDKQIRADLCLNFDQVWKCAYVHPDKVLCRGNANINLFGKRDAVEKQIRALQGDAEVSWDAKRRRVRGKDARADNIDGARHAMTMVTSLWGNGECGPLCLVLPSGFLSSEKILDLQSRFAPGLFIICTERESHFMNGDTVMDYFEQVLSPSFERRKDVVGDISGVAATAAAWRMERQRWAWLSRGMMSKEELVSTNKDVPDLTIDTLTKEMEECELRVEDNEWQVPVDEVFEQPDINRTTFLWQIQDRGDPSNAESWESEEDRWCCLPQQWQKILNSRLASYHASVQDAHAFYQHRKDTLGEDQTKTKNAKKKYDAILSGEHAISAILISKSSGKECSQKQYTKDVKTVKGVVTISVSKCVRPFKLDIKTMTLTELFPDNQEQTRQLRLVSATGRSREIQEIRVHLTALSLQSSKVLGESNLPKPNAGGGAQQDVEEPGDDQDDTEHQLAELAEDKAEDLGAEARTVDLMQ